MKGVEDIFDGLKPKDDMPVLRRAYVRLPWAHIREYPRAAVSIAVARALARLEEVLRGAILAELRTMPPRLRLAA
jgi:hypothetical protein